MIQAILFDLDGILVDFADYHYEALNIALEDAGCDRIVLGERETYEGLSTRQKLTHMVEAGRVNAAQAESIYDSKQRRTMDLAERYVKPDPAKVLMCRKLTQTRRIACVSNCVRDSVDTLLDGAGLLKFMVTTISNEDVLRPKPAPDPYCMAAETLGLSPEQCLAVEDHPRGIESATAAGCHVHPTEYAHVNLMNVEKALDKCRS